jgi:hypothetical protein
MKEVVAHITPRWGLEEGLGAFFYQYSAPLGQKFGMTHVCHVGLFLTLPSKKPCSIDVFNCRETSLDRSMCKCSTVRETGLQSSLAEGQTLVWGLAQVLATYVHVFATIGGAWALWATPILWRKQSFLQTKNVTS